MHTLLLIVVFKKFDDVLLTFFLLNLNSNIQFYIKCKINHQPEEVF